MSDPGESMVMVGGIPVPAAKAPAIRALLATIRAIAAVHGHPTGDAVLQAAAEAVGAGIFADGVAEAEQLAWLRRRVAAILGDGEA
jgi:transketolase N-terminal domain/subunit